MRKRGLRMKKMTNEMLYELKNVSQPLSVDHLVFYLETQMNKKENSYETTLWALDKDTQRRIPFGTQSKKYTQLKITPDQKNLSFLSLDKESEKMQVFVQPLTGGSAQVLTNEKMGVSKYFWTDEGSLIYQTTKEKEEKKEPEKNWPTATINKQLVYKMDGGTFLEEQTVLIKQIKVADEDAEVLIETNEKFGLAQVDHKSEKFYFIGPKDIKNEWEYGFQIYQYDAEQNRMVPLINNQQEKDFFDISISPDNKEHLLIGNDFSYHFVTQNEIYHFQSEGQLTCITENLDEDLGDSLSGDFQQNLDSEIIQWKNNEEFLFSTTAKGTIKLYLANINGDLEVILDKKMHITDWALDSSEEKVYLTYSTPTIPSRLAVYDLKAKEMLDLYDPNKELLKEVTLSPHHSFTYKGADDWEIHGWYVAPQEVTAKHPAILYIHGGPQVSYGETFFHEMQALAGAGYGVILLNPRGGSGYGQKFVASILGDYGNKDYQDLMMGVDAVLKEHSEIDPEQLYVVGGSYGGFMTNWVVTHTDRFKAAVTQRCISNWISFYGASDIGPHFVEHQLLEDLTNVEKLWVMSPLAHAEHLKTPLLVLHGQNDLRCPIDQGEQMYRAAQKQGVDTKLMTFPQSSHGLSREGLPNLRQERLAAIVDWFETH